MAIFSDIPDIGPGIEIYSVSTENRQEFLFRTTAGEYVLDKLSRDTSDEREYAIINEDEAIDWCLKNGKCCSTTDFFKKIWEMVCKVSVEEREEYNDVSFYIPSRSFSFQRALELMQLPVFKRCLIRVGDCETTSQVSSVDIDWLWLWAWINSLMSDDSFEEGPIAVGPNEWFERMHSRSSLQFRATWGNFSITAQCGYAVAPIEFPIEFESCGLDQGVWVKVEKSDGDCDMGKLVEIAVSAFGLLISSILLYEIGIDEPVDRTQLPVDKELFLG